MSSRCGDFSKSGLRGNSRGLVFKPVFSGDFLGGELRTPARLLVATRRGELNSTASSVLTYTRNAPAVVSPAFAYSQGVAGALKRPHMPAEPDNFQPIVGLPLYGAARTTSDEDIVVASVSKKHKTFGYVADDDISTAGTALTFNDADSHLTPPAARIAAVLHERRMPLEQYCSAETLASLRDLLRKSLAAKVNVTLARAANKGANSEIALRLQSLPNSKVVDEKELELLQGIRREISKSKPELDAHIVVIEKFKISMTWEKFSGLNPNTWFNDDILLFYMELLASWDAELCKREPTRVPCFYHNTHFMDKLTNEKKSCAYAQVKQWTKKVNVFALDKIFVPINIPDQHWMLCVVFMKERVIRFYDSMGSAGSQYMERVKGWLKNEYDDKKDKYGLTDLMLDEWQTESTLNSVPQQTNGDDCGLFVAMFMDYMSENLPLTRAAAKKAGLDLVPLDQTDMVMFREKVAYSILSGKLPYSLYQK